MEKQASEEPLVVLEPIGVLRHQLERAVQELLEHGGDFFWFCDMRGFEGARGAGTLGGGGFVVVVGGGGGSGALLAI